VVTNEVTTHLANPFEISVKKVEPIDQHGQTKAMTITNPNQTVKEGSLIQKLTMTLDGIEIESLYEEIEFDDESSVDYDMDYTVQE